ncbi:MAG: metallophosphoesterase [Planctomycetes bacterium]|nr:metallophosphoesterase [Planctomycetota bacterium]
MRLFVAAALSVLAVPLHALPPPGTEVPEGVVAIGDVHGDIETFRALLRSLKLIDEADRWCGGTRRLVQTGDILDRGAGSRQVIELMMRLEAEAAAAGGAAVQVLGNHEVMNVVGDTSCTIAPEFAAYAGDEDPAERARRREEILGFLREGSPLLRSSYARQFYRVLNERTFDEWFPPGFFAHRAAFSPTGKHGKWLLHRPVIHREGRTLFLHGGLHAKHASLAIEAINRSVKPLVAEYLAAVAEVEKLRAFDGALGLRELRYLIALERAAGGPHASLAGPFARIEKIWSSILFDEEGPLWYRGLADARLERALVRPLEATLAAQDADRLVIGHTQPPSLTVEARFSGRVILIDTGMNQAVYGGRPSAAILMPSGEVKVWE